MARGRRRARGAALTFLGAVNFGLFDSIPPNTEVCVFSSFVLFYFHKGLIGNCVFPLKHISLSGLYHTFHA